MIHEELKYRVANVHNGQNLEEVVLGEVLVWVVGVELELKN